VDYGNLAIGFAGFDYAIYLYSYMSDTSTFK
jgi:hypothetical protein